MCTQIHSKIQQDLLAKLDQDIGKLDEAFQGISQGILALGSMSGSIDFPEVREQHQAEVQGLRAHLQKAQATLRRVHLRRSRYRGSGLTTLLEEDINRA